MEHASPRVAPWMIFDIREPNRPSPHANTAICWMTMKSHDIASHAQTTDNFAFLYLQSLFPTSHITLFLFHKYPKSYRGKASWSPGTPVSLCLTVLWIKFFFFCKPHLRDSLSGQLAKTGLSNPRTWELGVPWCNSVVECFPSMCKTWDSTPRIGPPASPHPNMHQEWE